MVAAPLALAAVERGAAADRDEHVLQRGDARRARARRRWRRCGPSATRRGGATLRCGARRRARTGAAPRRRSGRGRMRARVVRPRSGRARRARGVRSRRGRRARRSALRAGAARATAAAAPPLLRARARVRMRDEPAEVRVALLRLDEQRHVRAAVEGQLGAGDRPDAEVLRRVRELERAVDPVVVGQRERPCSRARPPSPPAPRAARPRRGTSRRCGRGARRRAPSSSTRTHVRVKPVTRCFFPPPLPCKVGTGRAHTTTTPPQPGDTAFQPCAQWPPVSPGPLALFAFLAVWLGLFL